MNPLKSLQHLLRKENPSLGNLYLLVLVDDLSDEAGVRLPKLTPEMFSRYNDRQAWVQAVVATIRLGAKNERC